MKVIYNGKRNGRLKNIITGLILLLILIVATTNNGLADTYSQNPTDDALVNNTKQGNVYTNYYLSVYFDGAVYNRSYLKFDLSSIPDDAVINSAELRLYSITSPNSIIKPVVDLNYVANDSWSETTLNWTNRPAYDANILLDSSTPGVNSWQTFNLLKNNNWVYANDLSDNYLSLIIKEGEPLSSIVKQAWYSPDEYNVYFLSG